MIVALTKIMMKEEGHESGEGHESDVLISPSRFSVLALEGQGEVGNDEKGEDSSDEKGEDSSDEKGEDVNVDLDIEEGELVAKE